MQGYKFSGTESEKTKTFCCLLGYSGTFSTAFTHLQLWVSEFPFPCISYIYLNTELLFVMTESKISSHKLRGYVSG